jgi:hypothetical protein
MALSLRVDGLNVFITRPRLEQVLARKGTDVGTGILDFDCAQAVGAPPPIDHGRRRRERCRHQERRGQERRAALTDNQLRQAAVRANAKLQR